MNQKIRLKRPFRKACGPDFIILGLICIVASYALDIDDWWGLGFFAIAGLVLAGYRLQQMSRNEPSEILNNVFFTFMLLFSVFFIFGPLLQVFGNPEEIEYSRHFFSVTADSALVVLAANLIGFGISLVIGGISSFGLFVRFTIKIFNGLPTLDMRRISMGLVLVGLVFKIYVFYNDLFVNETISGMFRSAQLLLPAGIFLYFKQFGFDLKLRTVFFLCAMLLYSVGGLLEFNKTEIFIPLIAIIGGLLVRNITLTKLVASIVGIGILLAILQPINIDGRNEALARYKPSLEERFSIFQAAYRGELRNYDLVNIGVWSRLDYTSPDAAAMWLYENGIGGENYRLIPWVFVPRFLYPEKPEISGAGAKLTEKVLGFSTSSTGLGIFISGYYDLGWFGLIGASILAGFILAWYRAVIIAAQISKSTTLLIMGLFGHWTAVMISGDYLSTYLGPMVTSVYAFYVVAFIYAVLLRR
jgi:hypothetical protein